MSTATAFVFNKNYRDVEQIAHLMPAYEARRAGTDSGVSRCDCPCHEASK